MAGNPALTLIPFQPLSPVVLVLMVDNDEKEEERILSRIRHAIIGAKRNIADPSLFHKIALIPLLAWIGLGADGLSSSSYGPARSLQALGNHLYLAIFLALATALTVFIISYAYSRIIEHFPSGGGGYIVATHTIGEEAGVVSGSALLVDYMLTITVSLAACTEALFSFVPPEFQRFKLVFAVFLILLLIILNLRGVKESVMVLAPIFLIFIVTHILLLGYGIFSHTSNIRHGLIRPPGEPSTDLSTIGIIGILALFFRAYSLGAGTYTGIEAVANGLQIMREPKVQTGKRTMAYMASSLALVAGALFFCYLLWGVVPLPGKTLNAILADSVFSGWAFGGVLAFVTILSEGALLMVAAQTGFIDGPRVMANMAIDSWFPRRFASLSERLTMQDGILLMGSCGPRPPRLCPGIGLRPRGHVRHQRLHHLLPLRVRDVPLLLHPEAGGSPLEAAHQYPPHRACPLYHHPLHHGLREVHRGRLAHPSPHCVGHRGMLPHKKALPGGDCRDSTSSIIT